MTKLQIPVIDILRSVWEEFPELRLGQLLVNASTEDYDDLYYITDKELMKSLREYYEKYAKQS